MENNFLKSVQKSHHISHHTKKSHHTPEKSHHTIRYPISNFKAKYNKQTSSKRSLATFDQFYEALDADSKVRGDQFEKLVKWFLKTDPRWKNQVKDIWLWKEHPKRGEWGPDCGIDLVFDHQNGETWAVQAKCFAPSNSIKKEDMNSFIAESNDSRFQKRLLVSSTNLIGPNVDRLLERHQVVRILLDDLLSADIEYPPTPIDFSKGKQKDPRKPRPHQKEAIKAVVKGLKTVDRGQVLMACGTGKTLTSLWIKENMKASQVLVLLPSLSLLSQTLKEWSAAAKDPFKWICVCSDKSVAKKDKTEDDWITNTSEIGVPVTSDVNDIKSFLCEEGSKIVFSTYQSSPLIAEAQKDLQTPSFKVVFADEAHRCAGKVSSAFGCVLDETTIRSDKRLFLTATPKILSNQVKGKAFENDIEIASMDDINLFGETLYQLNFSDAIKNKPPLLTDYQVVVIGVDDPMIHKKIINRDLLTTDGGSVIDAEKLASKIALIKAIKDYDLRRIISFHGRVKDAQNFGNDLAEITNLIPEIDRPKGLVNCEHISGSMKSYERNKKLKRLENLKDGETRILSNARCLSEGVDIPTLDGIAFITPKSSQVDIIQAVGRAIRKSKDKTIGTIVIPVYLQDCKNADKSILESKFKDTWRIILALKAQDDSLLEIINSLRITLGEKGTLDIKGSLIEKKILFDLPENIKISFAKSIHTVLIENTSSSWMENYGKLKAFYFKNGIINFPNRSKLGYWANDQRKYFKRGKLSKSRIQLLEEINFSWEVNKDAWEENLDLIKEFSTKNKHTSPKDRTSLGYWAQDQRKFYKKGILPKDRIKILEKVPYWYWSEWDRNFNYLKDFFLKNGHSNAPVKNSICKKGWVSDQREKYKENELSQDQISKLNSINFTWSIFDNAWDGNFDELYKFVYENKSYPSSKVRLGKWLHNQKTAFKKGKLSKDRIKKLENLKGWKWRERN